MLSSRNLLSSLAYSIFISMEKQEVYDYLEVEFNVTQPSDLSERNKYIAYERLKHKLSDRNLSPDQYTSAIIKLSDHLDI